MCSWDSAHPTDVILLFLDINECTANSHNCHTNADCTNNAGSFTCACKTGYSGDGVTCNGKCECVLRPWIHWLS